MSRPMPPLATEFARRANAALLLTEVGETIRVRSSSGSYARTHLTPGRLEALYEVTFLRVFLSWEVFLEASFLRCVCGYDTVLGPTSLVSTKSPSLADAESRVLGSQDFVSWSKPESVIKRCKKFIVAGEHESIFAANKARLEWFAAVRHRIAHLSTFSSQQFDTATIMLAGKRYKGSAPGTFLRDWNTSPNPHERWIRTLILELTTVARQIAP